MSRSKLGGTLAVLGALVVTSVAAADERRPPSITPVSAHFTATGTVRTETCRQGAQTFLERRGTFSGTSTSTEPRLNGPVRISLKTLVNAGTGLGIATGKFRVRSSGGARAELVAVVSGSNRLDGFLQGRVGDNEGRRLSDRGDGEARRLFANFSATLAGGTLTGDLGAGTHMNDAVLVAGECDDD